MQQIGRNKSLFIHMVESFFTSWALMKASRLEPGNILSGVFFLLSFFLYRRIHHHIQEKDWLNVRSKRIAALLALVYTTLYMAMDSPHYVETLSSRLFREAVLCFVFTGFVILFYQLNLFLFSIFGNKQVLRYWIFSRMGQPPKRLERFPRLYRALNAVAGFYDRHCFLCTFLLCLLGWLPYYLYHFPGILTPDSINQLEQVIGVKPLSNHHPLAHTFFIGIFYFLGLFLSGSKVVALGTYTLFQMFFMALCAAYFLQTLALFRVRPTVRFLCTLFYMLVAYNAVFAVTVWKDIPFAGAMLLFSCCLLRSFRETSVKNTLLFVLSGILLCLFRSNGWYGFLICTPFLLLFYRKKARCYYPLLGLILLLSALVRYPLLDAVHAEQPDFVESISIPIQQVACVICNDRPLSEEQLAKIEQVVDLTYIKDLYAPTFADNMKELVRAGNPEYLASHKGDYLVLWLQLALSYPGDYLRAYIDQTNGYWYPDSYYLVAEAEGASATQYGISHTPLLRGPLIVKGKEISVKLGSMVPIYSLLWSMGVVFWSVLFCLACIFVRREPYKLLCFLPTLALYLTVMLATPVATEFRYVYFMTFSLPFYLMLLILEIEVPETL